VKELSRLPELERVMLVVRRAARELTGADGVTFVLREGDKVFYADEEAIGPLWKGQRFAASACISGWAMLHRESVAVEDIYADERIPLDAYRSTFVKSLAMVPIRQEDPIGAIGAYWATRRVVSERELRLLEALASAAAVAVANAELLRDLRAAVARAEAALQQRDELLSVASHELKTPLTSLNLAIEGVARDARRGNVTLGEKGMDRIVRAEKQVHRLASLVDHLLDYSRLSLGRMVMQPSELDLAGLVDEVTTRFRDLAVARTGQPIDVRGERQLNGCWDRDRLDQVITNLISNALKYGSGKPVWVSVERTERARLRVHDDGIGIAPADQQRIFERFYRVDSARSRATGGSGLGLSIVKHVAANHGGDVAVWSEPGRGSTFTLRLPAMTVGRMRDADSRQTDDTLSVARAPNVRPAGAPQMSRTP
jgi:signal transduction histidine kinase